MGIIKLKNVNDEQATENVALEEQQAYKQVVAAQVGVELPQETQEQWDDAAVLYEDERRTDETSCHYVLNNGTAKSVFNAEPVNFFDEAEKKWLNIDNSLEEKEDAFESKRGKFKTKISKVHKGKKVAITKSDKQISWEYLGKQAVGVANKNVEDVTKTVLKVKNGTQGKSKHINSSAIYENVEKDTDLEYCLQGNNLKENIIVKEKAVDYRYLFALRTEGLKLRLSDDNESLELYSEIKKEDGTVGEKVEFTIPSPYMYDANGVASDDVYYELEPSEDGKFAFAVVANAEWVNATDRVLPVTIDPQIVTSQNNLVTKQTYCRDIYSSYGSGSGSGTSYSSWYTTSTTNIKVYRSSYVEYKTVLTIKRNLINLTTDNVVSVKLILTPSKSFNGYLYCNGVWTYYNTANGNLKIDITNSFKNNSNSFNVTLEPYTYTDMQFYMTGEAPKIEIETLTDENVLPTKKTYSLAGVATEEVNFVTGETVTVFNDVQNTNALMGLSVYHVYKKHSEDLHVGNNFRLNLHERFEKNGSEYVYTDSKGVVHGFKEYHYYIANNGKKTYVNKSKSEITVNADGRLTDGEHELFVEYKSQAGLNAITKIEEYLHNEYYENRSDDEKQIEQQVESYKQTLENFVILDNSGEMVRSLKDCFEFDYPFSQFLSCISGNYLMTKDEVYTYNNLISEKGDSESIAALIERDKNRLKEKTTEYEKNIKTYYKEYVRLQTELNKIQLQTPIHFLTDEKFIKGYNTKGNLVNVYDRYGNAVAIEYERYDVTNPDKIRISRVYDKQENCVNFTYNPKNQLASITDVRGRKTSYMYDESGKLKEVIYDTGKHLVISYNGNAEIQELAEQKAQLKATLTKTQLSETVSTLKIVNESLIASVKAEEMTVEETAIKPISEYTLTFTKNSFNEMENVVVVKDEQREKYVFDLQRNLSGYYLEENGLVTQAENYEYQSYWNGNMPQVAPRKVTVQAKKESLYKTSLDSYVFIAGDSERTTLNQFNNAERTETSAIQVSADDTNTATTVVEYTYDDNQRLVETKTTVNYTNPVKKEVVYKKYNYNAYGDVIRTESYVEDEEYTTGKTIKETVYNKQGQAVKSFTYNSLDTSSKFYTETEYDETGKVTAEVDGTGENKTKFEYVAGTSVVGAETLANGSKFAYGRDYDDTVTAITQSTEDGEENSTQSVYSYGELVELKSGNNKVQYGYDYKRRLKTVTYNGKADYVKYDYTENANYDEIVTTNANNETVTVRKDKRGNILSSEYGNGKSLIYAYDEKNRLSAVTEKDGENTVRTFSYTYDNLDKLLTYNETNGVAETYAYNNFGQVTTLMQSTGMSYEYSYSADSTRKLEKISVAGLTILPKYDILKRNKGKEVYIGETPIVGEYVTYCKVSDHATNMPASVYFGSKKAGKYTLNEHLKYAYDVMGNITKITEKGELVARYAYDKLNRLVREDNKVFGKTWLFTYDNNGNIISKRETEFTLKANVEESTFTTNAYEYAGDKLLAYNGETFVYDEIGNPTTYRGKTATWTMGRRLTNYDGHTFTYDAMGRRLTKDGISFTYDSDGKVIKQSNGLEFIYDYTGVVGFTYGNNTYIYRKDVQGNIIAILNSSGVVVVKYEYDAWGNHGIEVLDSTCETLANLNPFRYRGYYYDTETDLYFLKSRYYDPEIGRFMTIDGVSYLKPNAINGLNLYAYCNNNPVMYIDPNGTLAALISLIVIGGVAIAGGIYNGVKASKEGTKGFDLVLEIGKGVGGGIATIGALMTVGGIAATLMGQLAAIPVAALGAAVFNIGVYIITALSGIKTPDPIEFPSTPEVPLYPAPITGVSITYKMQLLFEKSFYKNL